MAAGDSESLTFVSLSLFDFASQEHLIKQATDAYPTFQDHRNAGYHKNMLCMDQQSGTSKENAAVRVIENVVKLASEKILAVARV